jgi:hypothetical protein
MEEILRDFPNLAPDVSRLGPLRERLAGLD